MLMNPWRLASRIGYGLAALACVGLLATEAVAQSSKKQVKQRSESKPRQESKPQQNNRQELQRLQEVRERQVERQKQSETRRATPQQNQPAQKPQAQQQQQRPQSQPQQLRPQVQQQRPQPQQQQQQQPQQQQQQQPSKPPVAQQPKPQPPVVQQPAQPAPKIVAPAPVPAGQNRPVVPQGAAGNPQANLEALRQQRLDALQQQRRQQQQPGQPGNLAGGKGGAVPAPAGGPGPALQPKPAPGVAGPAVPPKPAVVGNAAWPNAKPVQPLPPPAANAKPLAPLVAVGKPLANGGFRTTSLANRRITEISYLLRDKFKPPVYPKGTGGPPPYPGQPYYPGQTQYPKHRIDRLSVYFRYFIIALGSAYAVRIPGERYCNCWVWIERESEDVFEVRYVPKPADTGDDDDAIAVFPDRASPPVRVAPVETSALPPRPEAVASAAPAPAAAPPPLAANPPQPVLKAPFIAPTPVLDKPAGPNSAAATLGGLGGAAFEACTVQPGSGKSPADGGNPAGTDDANQNTNPVHFMLETGGHQAPIRSIVFTASGNCLVSAGDDKVIRIWSLAQGRSDRVLRGEIDTGAKGRINALALSPDGTLLAAAGSMEVPDQGGHAIRLYDLRTGGIVDLLIGHTEEVRALAFSPDGRRLLSGSLDGNAVLWDIEALAPLQVFTGHTGGVIAAGFMADGARVATASLDATARLWNAADGTLITTLAGHAVPLTALTVRMSDGAIITAAQDGAIKLWNGRDGQLLRDVVKVEFVPGALVALPAGNAVVVTCADRCRRNFAQEVVSLDSGQTIASYGGHDGFVFAAAVTPDGRVATAGGTRHEIHLWGAADGKTTQILKGLGRTVSATGFYTDSRTIAWSYTFATTTHLQRGPMEFSFDLPVEAVTHLAEPLPFDKDTAGGFVHSVDRFGDWSIESGQAGRDTAGGKSAGGGGGGGGGGGASGASGTSGPRSAVVRILRNGAGTATIAPGGTLDRSFAYRTFGFLPAGEHVIAGGDNGLLETYDLAGRKAVGYVGHVGSVWTQTPSPDGRLLVSGGGDQTVKLWNLATGELIVTLFQASDGEWVMWTPQGYYTGSAGAGELIGWQVNRGPDKAAEYVRAQQFRGYFNRPDIIVRAIALATAQDAVAELAPQHVTPEEILRQGVPPVVTTLKSDPETAGGRAIIIVGLKENPLPVEGLDVWVRDRKVTARPATLPANLKREPGIEYVALDVPMFSGENIIRVAAINEVGASDQSEKRLSIRILHNGEGALDKRGTLRILAIGVDKYPNLGNGCGGGGGSCDLRFAGSDAEGFHATARTEMGSSHDRVDVTVLVNGKSADREPTLENIKAALAKVQREASDNDTVALFFAGHGLNRGGGYYFMPTDARAPTDAAAGAGDNALHWGDVQAVINQLSGRKLLFLDACHAGNSYYARLGEDARLSRFVAFTASTGAQYAQEAEEVQHGEFTYALIGGLKGQAAPQADAVLIYDLASYLHREVSRRTKGAQTPEFFPTPGDGNFALVKRQ